MLSDRLDCPAKSSDVWAMDEQPKPDVEERYDDGGFTGANTDRPAFQRLMADIDAGKVDVIAVYKVDRLSRSLLDFVKVMERLGRPGPPSCPSRRTSRQPTRWGG